MQNKSNETHTEADADASVPAAITDTGCERELNEDRYAVIDSPSGLAWIVCDGMGGVAGGELAAQLAVDAMKRDLEMMESRSVSSAIKNAFMEANRVIVLRRQNQAFAQMGTTAVAAVFSGVEMALAWVGDSRAYLIRGGQYEQLTKDHTYVQELVDKGEITAEEALTHPDGHILTKCIGGSPMLDVETKQFWLWKTQPGEANDIVCLCTDGLYSHVSDDEMAEIVNTETPQRACVRLVELAKDRGGYDNITVAIIPVGGQLRQEPPPGYNPEELEKKKKKQVSQKDSNPFSLGRTLLIIALLSIGAALLVAVGVCYYVSSLN